MAKNKANVEQREAELRRRMLNVARLSGEVYANGFVPFKLFSAATDDSGNKPSTELHAEALIGSLLEWGLLEEARQLGLGGVKPTNEHRRFKLTNKAFELWMRSIPPIPGVADDRLS